MKLFYFIDIAVNARLEFFVSFDAHFTMEMCYFWKPKGNNKLSKIISFDIISNRISFLYLLIFETIRHFVCETTEGSFWAEIFQLKIVKFFLARIFT